MIKVLYFASLREILGVSELNLPVPEEVNTVMQLLPLLQREHGDAAQVLFDPKMTRVAVNQVVADRLHPIVSGDEIAFFPPVTGG